MNPIVIVRPQPGATQTLQDAREAGLPVRCFPLFEIRPVAWQPVPVAEVDVLLLGSANAVRHAGQALEQYVDLPVHAVGRTTAQAAQDAGFRVERIGTGGLQSVVDRVIGPLRYLRLAGRHHVALETGRAVSVVERIVYESLAKPVGEELAGILRGGATMMLHSAVAAEHVRAECDRLGIDKGGIAVAALGPRIAAAAGEGWRAVESSSQPRDTALLALAAEMCH